MGAKFPCFNAANELQWVAINLIRDEVVDVVGVVGVVEVVEVVKIVEVAEVVEVVEVEADRSVRWVRKVDHTCCHQYCTIGTKVMHRR